jgi:hypothetical protein
MEATFLFDKLNLTNPSLPGKHNVSTLSGHSSRHVSTNQRHSNVDRISRSVNRRVVGTITEPNAGTSTKGSVQV